MALLVELESTGAADEVSLTLTDMDMPYERWESLGRFFGSLDRRIRWYIGDWLNFGEAIYGEQSAQAVEATVADRYDVAERITGLDHGTMMNIRSVCGRVARSRRRVELGFWIHAEVAALEADEQDAWLQRAVDEGLSKSDLRAAIRETKGLAKGKEPAEPAEGGDGLTPADRIEHAARLVYQTGQPTTEGDVLVSAEVWAQLGAALGEE